MKSAPIPSTLRKRQSNVVSWIVDPSTEEEDIVFVAPKGLSPGTYDAIVTDGVRSSTLTGGFIIEWSRNLPNTSIENQQSFVRDTLTLRRCTR